MSRPMGDLNFEDLDRVCSTRMIGFVPPTPRGSSDSEAKQQFSHMVYWIIRTCRFAFFDRKVWIGKLKAHQRLNRVWR